MNKYDPNYKPVFTFYIIAVKVVVINSKDEVLLLRRSNKMSRAGSWDFCGGLVDETDTSIYEAAIREAKEEAGLDISNPKLLYADASYKVDNQKTLLLGLSAYAKSNKVELSWEHDKFEWVTKEEALKRDLPKVHSETLKLTNVNGNQ